MELREIEGRINRGGLKGLLRYRSARLAGFLAAVNVYIAAPSKHQMDSVRLALANWRALDPKEYHDRGKPIETELECALVKAERLYRGSGTIPLVEPLAHPVYEPGRWNRQPVLGSTNCYAYACNDPDGHTAGEKPQPGQFMLHNVARDQGPKLNQGRIKAARMAEQPRDPRQERAAWTRFCVEADNQARKKLGGAAAVPRVDHCLPNAEVVNIPGHYLIALVAAGDDYHWYRQDRSGLWSHKPGHLPATNVDADGELIKDPRLSANTMSGRDYTFAGFYYVPRGGVRTASAGDAPVRR